MRYQELTVNEEVDVTTGVFTSEVPLNIMDDIAQQETLHMTAGAATPDLLGLDEPTLGLAPVILEDISDAIEEINGEGVTVLLVEQNVTFATNPADRIYLLENGDVVREGAPDELRGDDYIRESSLGG